MDLYKALARAGWRRWASYPGATAAGVFTNSVFGFLRAAVLVAALEGAGPSHQIGGYDRADALTYTWLTQGLIMVIALWRWNDLALRIQTGDIATDLSRPVDLQFAGLAEDYGRAAYHALFRGVPPFVLGALLFYLRVPASPLGWLAFVLSLVLAVTVSYALRFLVNLGAFWLLDWRGSSTMATLATTLLSGFAVPLAFLPAWAERLTMLLPWSAVVQIPVDLFLEQRRGTALVTALVLQAAWAVTLLAAGRALLAVATRRLVVQGG